MIRYQAAWPSGEKWPHPVNNTPTAVEDIAWNYGTDGQLVCDKSEVKVLCDRSWHGKILQYFKGAFCLQIQGNFWRVSHAEEESCLQVWSNHCWQCSIPILSGCSTATGQPFSVSSLLLSWPIKGKAFEANSDLVEYQTSYVSVGCWMFQLST